MADPLEERLGRSARLEAFVPRPLEEHLGWLMSRASHALGAALAEGLAPLGLNLRDYTVLIAAERAAVEGRPRTQLELAKAARLDKSTMVVAVDSLEREGLVERRPDPRDRRARIVAPTGAGRKLLARAEGMVLGVEDRALASLGAEDRQSLKDLLTRLMGVEGSTDDGRDT
jgi:DNA-binding MarR family transcriptional regulator